jgi:hypothetical protein
MKNINDVDFENMEYEIFYMPDVRIIGKAFRMYLSGENDWEIIWKTYYSYVETLNKLPNIMRSSMICWTGECLEGSKHYTHMPSIICPKETPVPEGLDYRDLSASYVAKGKLGNEINDIIQQFTSNGFITCYNDLG